jgi:hypothetical protein
LVTDSTGGYVAIGLLPGTYTVRVEAKGFKLFERQNLLLETGKDLDVDVILQPGSSNEVITITAEAPLVDTTTTTLGGTLSNAIINDLPLNGRNYQNLLTLRPGVEVYPGGGPWTQSTNGGRPESVGYLVDGLPNDEAFMGLSITNAAAVIGDAATILPVDAIQEFNTQVNPKAEFGWKTGAVTSVGLKSGTNELHGSAYAYGRSDSFDARNYFNPTSQPKVPVSLQQFGGTAGGQIVLVWGVRRAKVHGGQRLGDYSSDHSFSRRGRKEQHSRRDQRSLSCRTNTERRQLVAARMSSERAIYDRHMHWSSHRRQQYAGDEYKSHLPEHQRVQERIGESGLPHQRPALNQRFVFPGER